MKLARWIPILFLAGSLNAEPLVASFERFHQASPSVEGGALLYSELGCANCHGGGTALPKREGPVLAAIKGRANADWVAHFLADPQASKSGTMMPSMFAGLSEAERAKQVDEVTHYLMSLKPIGKPAKAKSARHSNAERGSALFHENGCVACHAPRPDFHSPAGTPKPDEFESPPVPLPDLKAKYSMDSLHAFLEAPQSVRPDGRMPHFQLEAQDAMDLACYLVDFQSSDPRTAAPLPSFKTDPTKSKRGQELTSAMNCAACHRLTEKDAQAAVQLPPTVEAISGCLSPEPKSGRPHYALSDEQRRSLELFVKSRETKFPEATLAQLTLHAFNCLACHQRDGIGGPDAARNRFFIGDEGIADAGRLPPPLTGIGQKLKPGWMEKVFQGEGRVRPYVKTKMPAYPQHAAVFTMLFQTVDAKPDLPELAHGDIQAGRKLLGIQGGVNCITCHVWGDHPSLGIQALDISSLNERLQPTWFRNYLLDPAAYRPGTLMPPLWPGGESMVKDVLGGNADKQIASIWEFISKGEGLPLGYPEVLPGAFELKPTDRPILQRTFMTGVGPLAILVGFPGGVNLAYDGLRGRPAKMWRGRFFDAYSTWFVRAAPFEDPLGEDVMDWPSGSDAEPQMEFGGYRLDKAGNPTFLLRVDGAEIEDHYEADDGMLKRTIRGKWGGFTHPVGALVEEKSGEAGVRTFVYSWK